MTVYDELSIYIITLQDRSVKYQLKEKRKAQFELKSNQKTAKGWGTNNNKPKMVNSPEGLNKFFSLNICLMAEK